MAVDAVLDLDIVIDRPDWLAVVPEIEGLCRCAAQAAFRRVWRGGQAAEATLLLTDDARIAELNRAFRGVDAPTNVLSFPASNGGNQAIGNVGEGAGPDEAGAPVPLGDMILAYETTSSEARREDKRLTDHVSHLVVHGILHLLGYDHQTDCEAEEMETLETSVLAGLGVADPYTGLDDL